jgi:uncharacterized membrane protein
MKKLSVWAKKNPWQARIIIIVSHIILSVLAWNTGIVLLAQDIFLPEVFLFLSIFVFLGAVLFYPLKSNRTNANKEVFYRKQKLSDFLLAASTFSMIVCIANTNDVSVLSVSPVRGSIPSAIQQKNPNQPTAAEILASLQYRDKTTLTRMEKKILKKEFKLQLKNHVKAKLSGNKKAANETGAIILTIIAALGLLYLVAALSCSLSCNGSEGAAIVLAVLGSALIIFGVIMIIRGINKKSREKKESMIPEN